MRAIGVTFTVYEGTTGVDRPWPFDIIPRVMPSDEWHMIESGLVQRLNALNLFIDDVYHDQRSVSSGVVPSELVVGLPQLPAGVRGGRSPRRASGPTSAGAT